MLAGCPFPAATNDSHKYQRQFNPGSLGASLSLEPLSHSHACCLALKWNRQRYFIKEINWAILTEKEESENVLTPSPSMVSGASKINVKATLSYMRHRALVAVW